MIMHTNITFSFGRVVDFFTFVDVQVIFEL